MQHKCTARTCCLVCAGTDCGTDYCLFDYPIMRRRKTGAYAYSQCCSCSGRRFVAKRLCRQDGEIRKMPLWWIPVYIAELAVCRMLWQMEYFDVRNNEYGQLFGLYFILALSGIAAVFSVATRVSKIPLLTFMGRHSLLYFAFGPHGYVIGRTVLKTAMRILQVETVSDNFNSLFVYTMASIAWILPAMLIDRICPVLNGKWTWKR